MSVKKFLKAAQEIQAQAQRSKEEPKPQASHDESNWLVSYADMMTLLCGFFIMLFSMAKMDEPQYEKVKESVKSRGASEDRAEEIAARTVNKERARSGESRTRSRTSTQDMSSGRRGGQRSGTSGPPRPHPRPAL